MKKLLTGLLASSCIGFALFTPVAAQANPVENTSSLAYSNTALSQNNERIIAGERSYASNVVQVRFQIDNEEFECSGSLIGQRWVLTARHCADPKDRITNISVATGTTKEFPGTTIPVKNAHVSPHGDVALLELSSPIRTIAPVSLDGNYLPKAGDIGTIIGFGLRANKEYSWYQYKARNQVIGADVDLYGGPSIYLKGIDGATNHGDSGGPLVINNQVVGVCSMGDVDDPGADKKQTVYYANIKYHRAWIKSISGI